MGRYLCSCGLIFRKKSNAEAHKNLYMKKQLYDLISFGIPNTGGSVPTNHFIIKRSAFDVFLDFIFRHARLIQFEFSLILLGVIFDRHFHINFNFIEAIIFGVGIGSLWLSLSPRD